MLNENYYEINKSKFYSYAYTVENLEQINKIIEEKKKDHKKATHVCYAYIVDDCGTKEKFNDDKEPKGTAGQPIMNVIKKKGLRNILIIVVRYFGGIKLGAGGVLRAYSKATSLLFKDEKDEFKINHWKFYIIMLI